MKKSLKDFGLTPRETEVAAQISKCTQRKIIADRLKISVSTLDIHLKHLRDKCKVETTFEVALIFSHYKFRA